MDLEFKIPNREKCTAAFNKLDTDGSKTLEASELDKAFKLLGLQMTPKEIEEMVSVVDENGDHKLDLDEFMHFVYVCQNSVAGDMKRLLFLAADKDYSKTIDQKEMIAIFKKLGAELTDADVDALFKGMSDNPDGTMSYKAYRKVLDAALE